MGLPRSTHLKVDEFVQEVRSKKQKGSDYVINLDIDGTILKEYGAKLRRNSSGSEQNLVAGSCLHGEKP
jgi:hypothetical protein